jgi:DNA-binding MarR family transcriptional regulator
VVTIFLGYIWRVAKPESSAVPALNRRGTFLLSQLGYHVAARCAEKLEPLGLHPAHYGVISELSKREKLSQQQLADAMGVHRNNMVGLIDDLESRGLVRRERHPSDRRVHQLHQTPEAHNAFEEANTAIDELEIEIFDILTSGERGQLVDMLQRTARHAGLAASTHPGLRKRRRVSAW